MDTNQSQDPNLKSQNLGQAGATNQPAGQSNQQFWQTPANQSTNLDPLTPPAAPIFPPTPAPAAPPIATPQLPVTPPPAITPDPVILAQPTPPAQDTFAPTAPLVETTAPTASPSPSDNTSTASALSPVKNALLDHYPTGSEIIEEDILKLLGSSDMSEEEKNDLYQKMNDTVANRVTARIVDALSDEEVDAWVKLLDINDQKGANDFLGKKDIDPAQLIAKEALVYKTQIVDVIYGSGK